MLSPDRRSVCRLSVCNVRAPYTQSVEIMAIFLRLLVHWPSVDIRGFTEIDPVPGGPAEN